MLSQATMETILLPDTLTMADSDIYEMLAFILSRNVFVLTLLNSKLDWNDNLAAIFDAKLVINRFQLQSPSIVFVGAVDTIFLRMYRDLKMF